MCISAAVDSLLTHPVLAHIRNYSGRQSGTDIADVEPSTATCCPGKGSSDVEVSAGQTSKMHTAQSAAVATSESSISLLLHVPLLTVSCYAEMPGPFGALEGLESKLKAMQMSG